MTFRRNFIAVLAASMTLCMMGMASADDVVARFEGTSQRNVGGHPVTVVGLTMMGTGKSVTVPIPNEIAKKGEKPMPKKDVEAAVKKLNPGTIVKVSVEPDKELNSPALATIEAYDLKPGEDTPNGYVFSKSFDKQVGKNTVTSVVLTKFGVEHNFTIATHRNEKGELEQDPDVSAEINKMTPDTGVWVQTQGKTIITAIEPYTEPQTGKVSKVAEAEVDGHKIRSAEIETDGGKAVTVYVPGKEVGKAFVQDAVVAGQLARVRAGSQVQFRTHEDGGKLWLREIEVEKPGTKKPALATPSTPTNTKPAKK